MRNNVRLSSQNTPSFKVILSVNNVAFNTPSCQGFTFDFEYLSPSKTLFIYVFKIKDNFYKILFQLGF